MEQNKYSEMAQNITYNKYDVYQWGKGCLLDEKSWDHEINIKKLFTPHFFQ